jgi:hypothetical protein
MRNWPNALEPQKDAKEPVRDLKMIVADRQFGHSRYSGLLDGDHSPLIQIKDKFPAGQASLVGFDTHPPRLTWVKDRTPV